MIKVKMADNGWIVVYDDYNEDDVLIEREEVIEEHEKYIQEEVDLESCRVVKDLLYTIMDKLDIRFNKHDAYRLKITIEDKKGKEVENG